MLQLVQSRTHSFLNKKSSLDELWRVLITMNDSTQTKLDVKCWSDRVLHETPQRILYRKFCTAHPAKQNSWTSRLWVVINTIHIRVDTGGEVSNLLTWYSYTPEQLLPEWQSMPTTWRDIYMLVVVINTWPLSIESTRQATKYGGQIERRRRTPPIGTRSY